MIESKQMFLPNLSPEMYYGNSALGSSKLKAFSESPLHYAKYTELEDTPSLKFGRAAHSYNLEPKYFYDEYCIIPQGMRRGTKAYKAFKSEHLTRTELTQKDFDKIVAMNEALMNSCAREYFEAPGLIESSLFWEYQAYPESPDHPFRIHCKGRLDKLLTDGETIIDYKTCADVSLRAVIKQMKTYKYWLQEQHYVDGLRTIFPDRKPRMIFVFQETKAPYDVAVVMVADEDFKEAREHYEQLMERLALCHVNNDFPGRHDGIIEWSFGN